MQIFLTTAGLTSCMHRLYSESSMTSISVYTTVVWLDDFFVSAVLETQNTIAVVQFHF